MYTRSSSWILPVILGVVVILLLCGGLAFVASRVINAGPTTPVATPVLPASTVTVATAVPPSSASTSYPLAGQSYSSPQGNEYSAVWTTDGRLWQPQLPQGNLRKAHTVGITIETGEYAFDGVECALYLDTARNGKGAQNPVTVAYGNDLRFTVRTADGGQAWGLVECRGNFSTGFQIRYLGSAR